MATLVVGSATGLDANDVVSRQVQQFMALHGVSVDRLTVALGSSYADTLCKLAGCGEWTIRDIGRVSQMLGIDGALLLE